MRTNGAMTAMATIRVLTNPMGISAMNNTLEASHPMKILSTALIRTGRIRTYIPHLQEVSHSTMPVTAVTKAFVLAILAALMATYHILATIRQCSMNIMSCL